ncbi:Nif3-like dinuclear metal center hexameric protein [Candidatus Woesearchaeota archaeon]|nr:Nif3-like dinuclear metal center hexameric protein [Candidatus Woesearchaeota archaeon]
MVRLNTIVRFLNKELEISKMKDYARNGLQARGKDEVRKVAVGLDSCMELFEKAKAKKCDMVIVHHGLLWKGSKMDDILRKRIGFLKKNKISLYAVHLPLDASRKYGNNIHLANLIGLKNIKSFCSYHGKNIGYYGDLKIKLSSLVRLLEKKLKTKCLVHKFGKSDVRRVGVVSGKAADEIQQCAKPKIDTFVTGETEHEEYHTAKEAKVNVIYGGHYKTETLGVRALERLLKQKFNIETVFIDIPTGL